MSIIDDPNDRERRAATNQALFREINERIKDLNVTFSAVTESGEWICECANDECVERVSMSQSEYEAVRAEGARFFVAPGSEHVWPDVEDIIERRDRYWIIEKRAEAGDLAERADPRSDDTALPAQT